MFQWLVSNSSLEYSESRAVKDKVGLRVLMYLALQEVVPIVPLEIPYPFDKLSTCFMVVLIFTLILLNLRYFPYVH